MASKDPLAGIDEKTTKADLMKKLNELADLVRGHERERTGRLGEIEREVRKKYKPGDVPTLHNVIFTATEEEWMLTVEFLEEFEDILPTALQRIRQGGRQLLGPKAQPPGPTP